MDTPRSQAILRRRLLILLVIILVAGLAIVARSGQKNGKKAEPSIAEIVEQRPAPAIEGLADRASPANKPGPSMEAFYDLLKVRDLRMDVAAAELIRVLEMHAGSSLIHRFAAEQALFAIGTDTAHAALRRHLLDPAYPVKSAIGHTAAWQMAEPLRGEMIRQYLLRDLSPELAVSVAPAWRETREGRRLAITLVVTNRSSRRLALMEWPVYQAGHLYFESPRGEFLRPGPWQVEYKIPAPKAEVFAPGESRTVEIELKVTATTLETRDTSFAFGGFGDYLVHAMVYQAPLNAGLDEESRVRHQADHWWTGRAVSKPVKITIRRTDVVDGGGDGR